MRDGRIRSEESELRLIAYRIGRASMPLVPAPSSRCWMDETDERFANRCLPLKIANQAGWFVLNDRPLRAVWDGGHEKTSVRVQYLVDGAPEQEEVQHHHQPAATSHFGHGILTFHVPYLFRTPPGYNLLVRGPANRPKDGVFPLEGLVESDWLVGTFTMNWQLTRPNHPVLFEEGEPICMLVPQRRGELESFRPETRDLEDDPQEAYDYWKWAESRWRFMAEGLRRRAAEAPPDGGGRRKSDWQKHYVRGTSPTGIDSDEHQTKLRLRSFEEGGVKRAEATEGKENPDDE